MVHLVIVPNTYPCNPITLQYYMKIGIVQFKASINKQKKSRQNYFVYFQSSFKACNNLCFS